MHKSIPLNYPCEFIEVTPYNPLISKCVIKVLYVDDKPNRNGTIITKSTAMKIAQSLPGSPIAGYYNEDSQDFEEHNRVLEIKNGAFKITKKTRPYGFVDLGARVWFQKFLDDDTVEREYLLTEGWIWTGQYPETNRIFEEGNNHSMEIDKNSTKGSWAKDNNGNPSFFIINEAIISELCILGEDYEPCFEGASITQFSLSFEEEFKTQLFSMMNEFKQIIEKGGTPLNITAYTVEIGDNLWNSLYSHLVTKYPNEEAGSAYSIEGIYIEDETQRTYAVLKNQDSEYCQLDFSLLENGEFSFAEETVSSEFTPSDEPQFNAEAYALYVSEYAKKKSEEEEGKSVKKDTENSEESTEDKEEKTCPDCGKPIDECECEDEEEEKKPTYSLEEIPEYVEMATAFSALVAENDGLKKTINSLNTQITSLSEFKKTVERKDKEDMIASFTMLSDEDKLDVVTNIDTYSLNDIEAKLAVICVRKKVSFSADETPKTAEEVTTYSLNAEPQVEDVIPDWVKAVRATAKNMNN